MGWLSEHIKNFVAPVLGAETPYALPAGYKRYFSSEEMTVLKNMWRAIKREAIRLDKPLLLPGRDVFVFEILARRENFPTVFRPDISRSTVPFVKEDYKNHFMFDTGFAGSIPRGLKCQHFILGSSNTAESALYNSGYMWAGRMRHTVLKTDTKQVFPRMKGARSLILKIERTPKYWRRGFYLTVCKCATFSDKRYYYGYGKCDLCGHVKELPDGQQPGIKQETSPAKEFLAAALLTIEIYTDKSPSFFAAPVEVKSHVTATDYTYGSD